MEEHPQARSIIETLSKAGFVAYYAGGWVRDFLLQKDSDDIDIATNAPPETIQALFPHTVPIGIAFGIILVIVDGHQYEVATFRQDFDYKDGRRPNRIAFASAEEDAKRRDFTINGMFYDPMEKKVLDYVGGKEDLQRNLIRAIRDPHERIREDRLRMVRAIRMACRFKFAIEDNTKRAILSHAKELFPAVAIERIMQELYKGKAYGILTEMLLELHRYGLLDSIFIKLEEIPLKDVKSHLEPTRQYPQEAPVIAFLLSLFPEISLEEALNLSKKLKQTNQDLQFVSHFFACKEEESDDLWKWAHLYASPFSETVLHILQAHRPIEQHSFFDALHHARREQLRPFIQRIQNKNPVLCAQDLSLEGITPGKTMGSLLKEAEKISIRQLTEDKKQIIEELKSMPLWKQV